MGYTIAALAAILFAAGAYRVYGSMMGDLLPPERAKELVDAGALLVDVRSPEEFSGGHIEGAKNIPVGTVAAKLRAFGKLEGEIVLYCRSGARSGRAKLMLEKNGFTAVHNLGAMSRW